jgi:hypothetical protein
MTTHYPTRGIFGNHSVPSKGPCAGPMGVDAWLGNDSTPRGGEDLCGGVHVFCATVSRDD